MDLRYTNTVDKSTYFRALGYEVIEMWECEFNELILSNPEIGEFVKSLSFIEPLNPRDGFYGGRTEMFQKYAKANDDEKIEYYDICSLYPFICKYGEFPLGHPKIFIKEEDFPSDLNSLIGFIKLTILPPKNLFFPVLPTKINDKLVFGLCYSCMCSSNPDSCDHSDEDRQIEGTFVIYEVRKALELGYKIIKIHEIWSYKSSKDSGKGLFTEYVDMFLKMKQESSGFPSGVLTDEDKQAYIKDMYDREKVQLDLEKIKLNPGLRSLAKMALNSLW